MLSIGAFAASLDPQTPFTGGELRSYDTFMYGRFIANMKSSSALGTGSSFYLFDIRDEFGFYIMPSLNPSLLTKMSRARNEEELHDDINLEDNDYHKYMIEWTPEYITYSIDDKLIRHVDGREAEGIKRE